MLSCGFDYHKLIEELDKNENKEWANGIREAGNLISNANWIALHRESEGIHLFYIIIKPLFDFSDKHMCYLAHECLHICQFFLKDILDRNREYEAEAYLHTHLMQQALKHLRSNETTE